MESWLNFESKYYDGHSGCNYVNKWNVIHSDAYVPGVDVKLGQTYTIPNIISYLIQVWHPHPVCTEPNHSNHVYSLEASVCCWHWIMKAASKNEFHTISKWLLTFEKQSFDLSSRQVGTKDVLLSCKKML